MGSFENNENGSSFETVPDFYKGKTVFITGGTGFIGKVIIEKLLYSCPEIDKIYMLIREKNKTNIEERIKELINSEVFKRVKEERPGALTKILPVAGSLIEHNLGIADAALCNLLEKVSVVIHCAANIKFTEKLSKILDANVEGTRRILDICCQMKYLKAYVHMSTTYCNTDQKILKEVVYNPPAALEDVYRHLRQYGDDEAKTTQLLDSRPNTYAYTKALAEQVVNKYSDILPTIIIRPSNVLTAKTEPSKGWIDSWNGIMVLFAALAMGLIRVVIGNPEYSVDIIPVDYLANLTVVSVVRLKKSNKVQVYNLCTSSSNPISLKNLLHYFTEDCVKHNYGGIYPRCLMTTNKYLAVILRFILEIVPVYLLDFVLYIRGKPCRYVKFLSYISKVRSILEFYTLRSWEMRADRTQELSDSLSEADRQQFPFDPRDIAWPEYIKDLCIGLKLYLYPKLSKNV